MIPPFSVRCSGRGSDVNQKDRQAAEEDPQGAACRDPDRPICVQSRCHVIGCGPWLYVRERTIWSRDMDPRIFLSGHRIISLRLSMGLSSGVGPLGLLGLGMRIEPAPLWEKSGPRTAFKSWIRPPGQSRILHLSVSGCAISSSFDLESLLCLVRDVRLVNSHDIC